MKQFVSRLVVFSFLLLGTIVALVFSAVFYCRANFDYTIAKDKNVLVLGDSQPECAVDDSLYKNAFNLSSGGVSYFYCFVKLRGVLAHNPHIDTVVLGYSYDNLAKGHRFTGSKYLSGKMRNRFFLFQLEDYLDLLSANPTEVLVNTPQIIVHSVKIAHRKRYLGLGKYHKNNISNLIVPATQGEKVRLPYSKYEMKYLEKIYQFCESNGVQLVLLTLPIHPYQLEMQSVYREAHCNFATTRMPNALLVNHASFKMGDHCYGDMTHLNVEGARIYSKYLNQHGLKENLQPCAL